MRVTTWWSLAIFSCVYFAKIARKTFGNGQHWSLEGIASWLSIKVLQQVARNLTAHQPPISEVCFFYKYRKGGKGLPHLTITLLVKKCFSLSFAIGKTPDAYASFTEWQIIGKY